MQSDWEFISKNKPKAARSVSFGIELELGFMENMTAWYSIAEYHKLENAPAIDWAAVKVSVEFDGHTVFQDSILEKTKITYSFDDSNYKNHQINIVLTGVNSTHKITRNSTGNINDGVMLRIISVSLENMEINELGISSLGQYITDNNQTCVPGVFLGSNGCQTLTFFSPIYKWLVEHRTMIIY